MLVVDSAVDLVVGEVAEVSARRIVPPRVDFASGAVSVRSARTALHGRASSGQSAAGQSSAGLQPSAGLPFADDWRDVGWPSVGTFVVGDSCWQCWVPSSGASGWD